MKKTIKYGLITIFWLTISSLQSQDLSILANEFIAVLTPELKEKTLFALDANEKFKMYYIPIDRKGSSFNDFNEKQKNAAIRLLRASLSQEGYRKATEIMALEKVLFKLENNQLKMPDGTPIIRDYLDYHFWIFGTPSDKGIWGWKFEGHHLSLNFSANKNTIIASTPSFMGTNPAIGAVEGFEKKQVLKQEMELGAAFAISLDEQQVKIAQFSKTAPKEIITANNRTAHKIAPKGISYKELNKVQQAMFIKLLAVYIDNYQFGFAAELYKKIKVAGIENLSFAYAGEPKIGKGYYYRIQGPMLLIEYDNVQNNANHVHSVVRDLTNDWAEDLLKKHYQKKH